MTSNPSTAMNTSTTILNHNPATKSYWKGVKLCVAKRDGSAEILHQDGRVERIGPDGRFTRDQNKETNSVTKDSPRVTQSYRKEAIAMNH